MKVTIRNRNGTTRVLETQYLRLGEDFYIDASNVKSVEISKPPATALPDRVETEEREYDMSVYAKDGQLVGEKKLVKLRVPKHTPKIGSR